MILDAQKIRSICPDYESHSRLAQEASTREFYRIVQKTGPSLILMQNTDNSHDITQIIQSQKKLNECGINTPKYLNHSIKDGWVLQEDVGNTHLLNFVKMNGFTDDYQSAISHIIRLQTRANHRHLPLYTEADLVKESMLFVKEFLPTVGLSTQLNTQIVMSIRELCEEISAIPQTVTHKDFHSTNLLVHNNQLFVVDQQDMCIGPWTYDLASLLFDCYIDWPWQIKELLMNDFKSKHPSPPPSDLGVDLYLCALQRHLKCLGLFIRLARNGKTRYLSHCGLIKKRILLLCDQLPRYGVFKIPVEMSL
jgi:aminoglycoside/choline kinase family phosphotransferase